MGNSAAMAYKRLLVDPCNAELTPSPYGDEAGSAVRRIHMVYNNSNVAQLFVWHPVYGVFYTPTYPGNSTLRPIDVGQADTAGGTRALAGCLEAMYIGAESSRAGTFHCCVVPGTVVWNHLDNAYGGNGALLDLASLAARFTHIERVPVDRCSVNWFPADGDADFVPNTYLNGVYPIREAFSKTHWCAIFVDTPAVNSVRMSFTSVIEQVTTYTTTANNYQGVPTWGITPSSKPRVDVPAVVRSLASQDPSWYLNTFKKVAKFGLGLATSVARGGLPGALGYLAEAVGAPSTAYGGKKSVMVRSAR